MNRADSERVAVYCRSEGYEYRSVWENPPLSGVLFLARAPVRLCDVVDAGDEEPPFLVGRARRRGRRDVAVIVVPLRRPVPNMILAGTRGSILPSLGIALREDQRLRLEGDFNSHFSLYCPREYEQDALYVFTPDVMALMIDTVGVRDVEFVDDRLLLYAPVEAIYRVDALGNAKRLVDLLHAKLDRQTRLYSDLERAGAARKDPFRRAQLTTQGAGDFVVGNRGRRIRLRTTALQKIGIGVAALGAVAAGSYWLWMVFSSFIS
ncbi:MAG: hypothetical protein WAK00_05630 [Microbacterium sp.]|uniref:hypothetical protein n=1 Tax=Microbacterium sp. TaxID=51671 RepID=UPI003BAFEF04